MLEDEANWQDLLRTLLEAEGYEVEVASTMQEAQDALNRRCFHVAVVDISLDSDPGTTGGMALLPEIEKRHDVTNVLMVTGYATVGRARDAFVEHGVMDFVEKQSLDAAKFKDVIRNGVRDALTKQTKDATVGFRWEAYMGAGSLQSMSRAVVPEAEYSTVADELKGFLLRLLRGLLPLSTAGSRIRVFKGRRPEVEVLVWSRERGEAVILRFGRAGLSKSAEPTRYGPVEERESHASRNFVGSAFGLPKMQFRDFLSALEGASK